MKVHPIESDVPLPPDVDAQRVAEVRRSEIEQDMPRLRRLQWMADSRGRPSPFAFRFMLPGDSFFVEDTDPDVDARRLLARVSCAASNAKRNHGLTFTTRAEPPGYRVWRIA